MTTLTSSIAIERAKDSRIREVDFKNLEFGNHLADHMLVADYDNGQWQNARVVPFADISVSPAMLSLHYGQSVFEGMKAFKTNSGEINVFRPQKHLARLNRSLERMVMPAIPEELFLAGLEALISVDHKWIPDSEAGTLYIRPLVFATEGRLGVKVSSKYKLIIMTSPVGPYQAKPY